eukprot:g4920.t1
MSLRQCVTAPKKRSFGATKNFAVRILYYLREKKIVGKGEPGQGWIVNDPETGKTIRCNSKQEFDLEVRRCVAVARMIKAGKECKDYLIAIMAKMKAEKEEKEQEKLAQKALKREQELEMIRPQGEVMRSKVKTFAAALKLEGDPASCGRIVRITLMISVNESDRLVARNSSRPHPPRGDLPPWAWVGVATFQKGYKKVLLSTHPLVIKEIDGPTLNLHAQPILQDTSHIPSAKQCEAITESTGRRCEWKLSAARRHTTQENRRATILEVYRSKLRAGFLPPTNSFLLSPNECLTVEWVKPLVEQKVAKPAPYLPTPSISPPTSSLPHPQPFINQLGL